MDRYLRFLVPEALSFISSSSLQFALIWTLAGRYPSGSVILAASAAAFLPSILLLPLAGAAADGRWRKAAIIASDAASAMLALLLLAATYAGYDTLPVFLLVLAGRSAASGFQTPAAGSVLPLMVRKEDVARANGIRSAADAVSSFISPAIAGILLGSYGLHALLLLDIITAAAAVLLVALMDIPGSQGSGRVDILAGIPYVSSHRGIRDLLAFHSAALFLLSPGAVMTPLLVAQSYSSSPSFLAASETVFSLGMITGGIAASAMPGSGTGRMRAVIAAYGILLALMGLGVPFPLYLILNAAIGAAVPLYTALLSSRLQLLSDSFMQGRIMAMLSLVSSVSPLAGTAVAGPLSDAIGTGSVFMISGAGAAVLAASSRFLTRRMA